MRSILARTCAWPGIINLTPCTYVQKHCTNACNKCFPANYVNPRCIYQELDQFKILVDTTRSKIRSFLTGILLQVWRQFWHFLAYALATFKTIAWCPNSLPLCGLCSLTGFECLANSTKHRSLHNLFFHLLAYLPEAELCCASTVLTSVSHDCIFTPKIFMCRSGSTAYGMRL